MSDIMSKIYDDMEEYLELCKFFNEAPVIVNFEVDPYTNHAKKLKKKIKKIRKNPKKYPEYFL